MKANQVIEQIKIQSENSNEITYRKLTIKGIEINLVYVDSLVNSSDLSNYVIKSFFEIINTKAIEEKIDNGIKILDYSTGENKLYLKEEMKNSLYAASISEIDYLKDDIFYYIYSGFVICIRDEEIFAIELKKSLERSIAEPTTEGTIKGPKDSFVENYKTNLGLIRKRIKTEKLNIKERKMGRRTKTQIGILYITDIAKKEHIEEIEKKLDEIDIDGIMDSNEIREILISGGNITDFPTILNTERPDLVSSYLLQGRIAIIVDNSPYVLILPSFLSDHFKNPDDYYQKNGSTYFMRFIRILAFILTLVTPALYIALTTFNHEALPTDLLISFAVQRSGVPFPAVIEAIIMIISFEFLKEGDNRVPSIMGSTLSIVGALVIGDAAVSAGIISPIMIIVIAMTKITGLLFSDVNLSNAIRNWRLIFLGFSSLAGLVGFMVALILFTFKLSSINILHSSYMYPFEPLDISEMFSDTLVRKNTSKLNKRKEILTNNITKLKTNKSKEVLNI